jgi:hypothetical protein
VKPRARRRSPVLAPGFPEAERPLSPARAFVVQFREEAEAARPHFTGRVEHMVSGRAARFHSPEELMAFFTAILAKEQAYLEVIIRREERKGSRILGVDEHRRIIVFNHFFQEHFVMLQS